MIGETPSLESWLSRALEGPFAARAEKVAGWMRDADLAAETLEASVRGAAGHVTGGRMMIERVPPAAAPAFFDALGVAFDPRARAMADEAHRLGLMTIAGWDAPAGAAKLYVNASDASRELRVELASALGLEGADAPHVVGLNVRPAAIETKSYAQSALAPGDLDPALASRLSPFVLLGIVGGWVVSRTHRPEGTVARAMFAAIKAGHPDARDALGALPGWSDEALAKAAPFPLAALTSIGFDARSSAWTVYFKAPGVVPASWSLEPVLIARAGDAELGLFVEPAALGRRAWAVVAGHALSYRVRAGAPEREALEALMRWAGAELAAGTDPAELGRSSSLPTPWRIAP